MIKELLKMRNIPELKTREEMLYILQDQEYGFVPPAPDEIRWDEVVQDQDSAFFGGKLNLSTVTIHARFGETWFSFPIYCAVPAGKGKYPFFIHVNFRDNIPDRCMPTEEIIDNGFAVISFCYNDVTKDNDDFTDGLAGVLYKDREPGPNDPGKIAMWAWACMRAMDYAQSRNDLDLSCGVICGHSRLGKTALLAGALDERFAFVYANDSGCSGAAITRGKAGEKVRDICDTRFPYWFCKNYRAYMDCEDQMPFDQHYLLACIAPRYVSVGGAVEDVWADPNSEYLACCAASEFYIAMGKPGFVGLDRLPEVGDEFFDGSIGFHLRSFGHAFSREDWNKTIRFINQHR